MKKTYIIIGGVTAVLLLLAIWVYLLIYGTPKPVEQFFTDFSFSGTSDNSAVEPIILIDERPVVDTTTTALRQLTTRPVIGMGEYIDTSVQPPVRYIRYAEAGTGHVYSINIITGEEIRLSNNTIINASRAIFSPNGQFVTVASGYTNQPIMHLITLSQNRDAAQTNQLAPKMIDVVFSNTNELMFTEYSTTGLTGRSLNPQTLTTQQIFTVPFQSARIVWGKNANENHYVYPKPSSNLPGFIYKISKNSFIRETASGNGLLALANKKYLAYTINTTNGPVSFADDLTLKNNKVVSIIIQPEKCVFSNINEDIMYCGYENTTLPSDFPDIWYKGLLSFTDNVWEINLKKEQVTKLIDISSVSGRGLDIINMQISTTNEVLYFINKNDNTLWMYEI